MRDNTPSRLLTPKGTALFPDWDRFILRSHLGSGGTGVVYEAFDTKRDHTVALKMLTYTDPEGLARLKQEFRTLVDLDHPNLVKLYELHEHKGQWFYTMELLDGTGFRTYVRFGPPTHTQPNDGATIAKRPPRILSPSGSLPSMGKLTPEALSRLSDGLIQIVEGLSAVHEAGQLHRDIKPSNVLVTREGRAVILDFGLVTEHDIAEGGRTYTMVGTPAYMAPELLFGRSSPASDWYSLGVMLYETLTGQVPFPDQGNHLLLLMRDKIERKPKPPHRVVAEVPKDLSKLCMSLIRRTPERRPSADQILDFLERTWRPKGPQTRPIRIRGEDRLKLSRSGRLPDTGAHKLPFFGRDNHLAAIGAAVATTAPGRPSAVWIRGASGSGKSALVRHYLRRAERQSQALILRGHCSRHEYVPFKALDSLVEGLVKHLRRWDAESVAALMPKDTWALARLFPAVLRLPGVTAQSPEEVDTTDPKRNRNRGFAAFRSLLRRLATKHDGPLLLVIDNLQWGDQDSLELLEELMTSSQAPALTLLMVGRSESDGELVELFWERLEEVKLLQARVVEVGQLSMKESEQLAGWLIEHTRPDVDPSLRTLIAHESGGQPFFIQEMIYSLPPEATVERVTWRDLEGLVWERIGQLGPAARDVLELICVNGAPIERNILLVASDHPGAEAALNSLFTAHLVNAEVYGANSLDVSHDRIRQAILHRLPEAEARAHHMSIAKALQSQRETPPPELLARHLEQAGGQGASQVLQHAAREAERAMAFELAAELYQRALFSAPDDTELRHNIGLSLGRVLINAGSAARGAEVLLELSGDRHSIVGLKVRRSAAVQLLAAGQAKRGLDVAREVLADIGLRLPTSRWSLLPSLIWRRLRLRIRSLDIDERSQESVEPKRRARLDTLWTLGTALSVTDVVVGANFVSRHNMMAFRTGDTGSVARGMAMEAVITSVLERKRARTLLDKAYKLASGVNDPYALALCAFVGSILASNDGRIDRALRKAQQGRQLLESSCPSAIWELHNSRAQEIFALFTLGQYKQLSKEVRNLLHNARRHENSYALACFQSGFANAVWLMEDNPAVSARHLTSSKALVDVEDYIFQKMYVAIAECHLHLYTKRADRALAALAKYWKGLESSQIMRWPFLNVALRDLKARVHVAAVAAGIDVDHHRRQATREARAISKASAQSWGKALSEYITACLAIQRTDTKSARIALEVGIEACNDAGMAMHSAAGRHRLGRLLGGSSGRLMTDEAEEALRFQGVASPERYVGLLLPD